MLQGLKVPVFAKPVGSRVFVNFAAAPNGICDDERIGGGELGKMRFPNAEIWERCGFLSPKFGKDAVFYCRNTVVGSFYLDAASHTDWAE